MLRRYKGTWRARVQQDFEVDAESEDEAREMIDEEMNPHNVVELLDMEKEITDVEDLE